MRKYIHSAGARSFGIKNRKLLVFLIAVVIIAAGAVFVGSKCFHAEPEDYTLSRNVFLDQISVNGIHIGGMTYNDALDAVVLDAQNKQSKWKLDIACNGFVYSTLSNNTLGIAVDYAAIEAALRNAWQFGHVGGVKEYRKDVEMLKSTPHDVYVGLTGGTDTQVDYVLNIISDNIYRPAADATILSFDAKNEENPFVIQREAYGQCIDVSAAKEAIMAMAQTGESGRYDIPVLPVEPHVTQEEISQSVTLLATAKNAIDKYSTKERNDNIALAFSKINGLVLENGDRFSFNKVVGKRSEENGYKPALGYVSGELVEVVGGGVCQVSTSLYSAALCAGLTITERKPHSMPVSYIELGQDATVNDMRGHTIDLKFKNETGFPVYITAAIEETSTGRLMSVVRIFGHSLGDDIHYRVESIEIETLPIPDEVVTRKDTKQEYVRYTDQRYKYSKGSEGHVVETYLQKLRGSTVIEQKLISKDTYKAQPVIEYVGTEKRQ